MVVDDIEKYSNGIILFGIIDVSGNASKIPDPHFNMGRMRVNSKLVWIGSVQCTWINTAESELMQ